MGPLGDDFLEPFESFVSRLRPSVTADLPIDEAWFAANQVGIGICRQLILRQPAAELRVEVALRNGRMLLVRVYATKTARFPAAQYGAVIAGRRFYYSAHGDLLGEPPPLRPTAPRDGG